MSKLISTLPTKPDYSGELNVEVWYRTSPDQTQWERAMSLWESADYLIQNNVEWDIEEDSNIQS